MHIYFDVGSTMINSLPLNLIKQFKIYFLYRFRQNRIQDRSAIYQNRLSKRIENTHFAFICTTRVQICNRVQIYLLHLESEQICTRVQILKTPFTWPKYTRGANLHPGCECKFAPRRKFLKHLTWPKIHPM